MADEKLNTGPAENISPEAAEPIATPEQAAASEPQQEQTGPAIPVENGKIGVCIMKDLTRWGRDYLQVGNAMEIFRRNNVRFIAVNNGIDSEKPDTLEFAPFINIMSEWYAKDISKKVKTGIKTKGMSGKPIVTEAPYGYVKDPDNKDFWIIDEEAAEVVRLIFRLFIGGKNRNQIAVHLKNEQIPTPTFYMKDRGRGTCKNKTLNEDNRCKWNKATLTNILTRQEYCGDVVNFKTTKHFRDKHNHYVDRSQWHITENVHEPIISRSDFETVQRILENAPVRRPNGDGEIHPLSGLLFCKDCGAKMHIRIDYRNGGKRHVAPLRNIFNEWLVRDTSKKIKAVKRSKGMSGKPITSKPVYGYLMDEDENFIIDEEAAPVVKQIYNLCLAGNGPTKIARMLTEQQIPTPGTLEYRRTGSTRRYHPGYECKWATNTVVHILENREYTGCLVNFKTEKLSYKVKHSVENPPEKQVIFENHHEPIIDTQTWERVQELRKQRKRPNRYDEVGLFSGILFCADCGSVMYQQRYQTDKRKQDCYICGNYKKRTHDCTAHFIRTDLLTAGVLSNLRKVTSYAAKHEARFMKLLIEQNEDGGKRRNAAKKKELEATEKRIAELSAIFKRLYEDSVTGRISDERFTELSADYEAEQRELKERAAAIQAELSKAQEATVNAEKFMNVVRRHTSFEELTPTLLREFVEKIVVHECSYDENKTRRQDIEIYYSFVGKVDLPE